MKCTRSANQSATSVALGPAEPIRVGDTVRRMSAAQTAWVIGATSVLGYRIARMHSPDLRMVPWCSRHQRATSTLGWRRIDLEQPRDWAPLRDERPDHLLYCGGVCNVARCQSDPEHARAINVGGIRAMLEALPEATRLTYCSSDHVFGGVTGPCTESSPPQPISEYGRMRVEAEHLVATARPDALIVRVGLPIGPSLSGRIGHLDWLRYRHRAGLPMTVIDGEARAAVSADAAARRIVDLACSDVRGIRHLAATRLGPRPELARHLCTVLGIDDPRFEVVSRGSMRVPHLGVVDLRTEHRDALAQPLPSALDL